MRKLFEDKIKYWISGEKAYNVSLDKLKRIEEPEPETREHTKWNVAKELLSRKLFPESLNFGKGALLGESHTAGRGEHSLTSFKKNINSIEGFGVQAIYSICPKCGGEVRSKYLVMFNENLSVACYKWFVKHGEAV